MKFDFIFMKIKAVILAAGEGSRLYPFSTRESPKILLHFLGKPLLLYHIAEFLEHKIEDFIIVCNPWNKIMVQKVLATAYPDLKVVFVVQKELLGPGQAIYAAKKELQNTDFFVLKYADSFSPISPLPLLLKCLEKDPKDGVVLLSRVKDFKRFGIARFRDEKLVQIIEKPRKNPPSDLAWRGMSILSVNKFLQGFQKKVTCKDVAEVPSPEYVLRVNGVLNYKVVQQKIFDLGYPWDILTYNHLLLDKFGSRILSKKIGKDVQISPKSYIGPKTVLEDGVKIGEYVSLEEAYVASGTEIRDSYVMPEVHIGADCEVRKSVIGEKANVGSYFKNKIKSTGKIRVFIKGDYKETPDNTLGCFLGPRVKVRSKISCEPGRIVYPGKEVNKNIVQDILPIKAILFDADNTLYRSKEAAKSADLQTMQYLALGTIYKPQELYQYWHNKIVASLKKSKMPAKRHRQYSYQKLITKFRLKKNASKAYAIFLNEMGKKLETMPYLVRVLRQLKDYKKAIISEDNQDLIDFKLKKLGLEKFFDLIVAAETIGKMKPEREYYSFALGKLKVFPGEAVMVGDSWERDLKLAYELGIRAIKWGEKDERAHRNIRDFRELPKTLNIM